MTAERQIGLFQALVAGDVGFRPADDRAELLKMAKEALGLVLAGAGGQPRAGIPAKAVLTENGERRIEMETGMDEVAFVRKLEDAIVRLHEPGPGADAIHLRAAFRTEFPGAAELGFDDFLPVVSLVRAFLVGSVPGLGATLERLSADPFVLRVGTHFQQPEHHGHPMRATVGSTLF